MPWAFLLVERVLYFLFHDLYVCRFEAQSPLVLGLPGSGPLYDGIAGFVLQVFGQWHSFPVFPAPHAVLVDLHFESVDRESTARCLVDTWLVESLFPCSYHLEFLLFDFKHEIYSAALASIVGRGLEDDTSFGDHKRPGGRGNGDCGVARHDLL